MKTIDSLAGVCKKAAAALCLLTALNTGFLASTKVYRLSTPIIETQEHGHRMLTEEIAQLGLQEHNIALILSDDRHQRSRTYKEGSRYVIVLNPFDGHNLYTLKYELYHIADDQAERYSEDLLGQAVYFFYFAPKAAAYGMLNIRL